MPDNGIKAGSETKDDDEGIDEMNWNGLRPIFDEYNKGVVSK